MKTGDVKNEIIPPQDEGAKKDIEHVVEAANESDAKALFRMGRNRLVDVNHWHEYAHPISATFQLTDQNGVRLERAAEIGDHFRIDIPAAPGSDEGRGYDWVQIEAVEDKSDPDGDDEIVAMRVRPTPDPQKKGENIAHFFKDVSTSSFVIERHGTTVKAGVYGRNEVPNITTSNVVDKIRNAVVGATAILGFANIQWKNLVKGIVQKEE